jgi:hypothetical protein
MGMLAPSRITRAEILAALSVVTTSGWAAGTSSSQSKPTMSSRGTVVPPGNPAHQRVMH